MRYYASALQSGRRGSIREKRVYEFVVEIAGVPAAVRCRFEKNMEFFHDYFSEKTPQFTVEVHEDDIAFTHALLKRWFGEPIKPYDEAYVENQSIQNVLTKSLLDYNVLLMHGSALCMDGEGYIFTAHSGVGKSTHSRFWREAFGDRVWMINDDKPMIRVENGKATVYGNPWDGKHHLSRNASAPLKAIIKLERDAENHIEPISKADMFPVMMIQGAWSKRGPQKLQAIQLEKDLMDAVQLFRLGCNLDPEAARIAWEGMNK